MVFSGYEYQKYKNFVGKRVIVQGVRRNYKSKLKRSVAMAGVELPTPPGGLGRQAYLESAQNYPCGVDCSTLVRECLCRRLCSQAGESCARENDAPRDLRWVISKNRLSSGGRPGKPGGMHRPHNSRVSPRRHRPSGVSSRRHGATLHGVPFELEHAATR